MTKTVIRLPVAGIALLCFGIATPAGAVLPDPVRAMIEAARETGDAKTIDAVIAMAKKTNPDDAEEIDVIAREVAEARQAEKERLAQEKEEKIRSAGLLGNWSGKGELGASRSTGNSDDIGLTAALTLNREGIDWSHKLRGRIDYLRSRGVTTREKYFAAYEPRYQIDKGIFAYALGQFESDRFQGVDQRYSASGGFGYQVLDGKALNLSIKAGPAFRRTDFTDGTTDSSIAGLFGLDFDWRLSDHVTFTQDSNVVAESGGEATLFVGGANTTLDLATGLNAKITDRMSTRIAYTLQYVSDPPVGAVATDTQTRFSIVYGF